MKKTYMDLKNKFTAAALGVSVGVGAVMGCGTCVLQASETDAQNIQDVSTNEEDVSQIKARLEEQLEQARSAAKKAAKALEHVAQNPDEAFKKGLQRAAVLRENAEKQLEAVIDLAKKQRENTDLEAIEKEAKEILDSLEAQAHKTSEALKDKFDGEDVQNIVKKLTGFEIKSDAISKYVDHSLEQLKSKFPDAAQQLEALSKLLDERQSGVNEKKHSFDDVTDPNGAFYDAIYWAAENGITTGVTPTMFYPDDTVTRGQMVTFLWRYAGSPAPSDIESGKLTDVKEDSVFYKAIIWALQNGITTGFDDNTFRQDEECTRGQIVTFLWRYAQKPERKNEAIAFSDVKKDGNVFYDAIYWAAGEGITTGFDDNTFRQDDDCTRGQGVTFLYRYNQK